MTKHAYIMCEPDPWQCKRMQSRDHIIIIVSDKKPFSLSALSFSLLQDAEGNDRISYKKVAIVEDFFEIIYNLHVCRDGKEHKHMGQKRTYRAVSIYSILYYVNYLVTL